MSFSSPHNLKYILLLIWSGVGQARFLCAIKRPASVAAKWEYSNEVGVLHTSSLQIAGLCCIFSVAVPVGDATGKMGKGNFEMFFVLALASALNVHQARVMFHTS
jgi:hypothetical protein